MYKMAGTLRMISGHCNFFHQMERLCTQEITDRAWNTEIVYNGESDSLTKDSKGPAADTMSEKMM